MSSAQWQAQAAPAQLAFLAIYSPTLGPTDETFPDQLVYYYSRIARETRANARRNARNDAAGGDAIRAEENKKLRHIGLAQGMVDFARGFSEGLPVDSVDTEKSRVVLHELEKDWWILASIDLARLPVLSQELSDTSKKTASNTHDEPSLEYSARDISPSNLLVQQLLQAHYIFTLHHGPSLSELFVRMSREKFCTTLERFWNRFARSWDVLLHGNPAADIFSGIKLSSGGELGMGVGEEEWGSGEREVLEDLTGRIEGLLDLLVFRFGESAQEQGAVDVPDQDEVLPWMGSGNYPTASNGLVFGGIGSISRRSIRNISLWMRHIYTFGDYAYGVRDNPTRDRRKRRRHMPPEKDTGSDVRTRHIAATDAHHEAPDAQKSQTSHTRLPSRSRSKNPDPSHINNGSAYSTAHPGIPPPIVSAVEKSLNTATEQADAAPAPGQAQQHVDDSGATLGIPGEYMKYLTFGLSTFVASSRQRPEASRQNSQLASKSTHTDKQSQSLGPRKPSAHADSDEEEHVLKSMDPMPDGEERKVQIAMQKQREASGHFLIGLRGDLNNESNFSDDSAVDPASSDDFEGTRTVLRTLQVELAPTNSEAARDTTSSEEMRAEARLAPVNIALKNYKRVRVLVYVHRPFIYCFLFEGRAPSLSMPRFYTELHRNLLPIHKPLLSSTSAAKVAQRLEDASFSASTSDNSSIASGSRPSSKTSKPNPIYDLIYDPSLLTVHTSIPNIPEPGTPAAEGIAAGSKTDGGPPHSPPWTRVEALNAHNQVLNTLASTQRNAHEYERTSKTSRGWWVVWMKLPPPLGSASPPSESSHHARGSSNDSSSSSNNVGPTARQGSVGSSDTVVPSAARPTTDAVAPPLHRVAFVLRKASDVASVRSSSHNRSVSASTSLWNALSLRPSMAAAAAAAAGGSAATAPTAELASAELPGAMGFDARRYIEGLLSLNR